MKPVYSSSAHPLFTIAALLLCFGVQKAHAETIYALGSSAFDRFAISVLYSIDSTTGVRTVIGSTGQNLRGLAIDSTGRAYASESFLNPAPRGLWEVDLSTGTATFIGGTRGMSDMVFDASGTLYGIENRRASGCRPRFYSIDTTTGAETFLAQSTLCTNLWGFTYSVPDNTFYWSPNFTLRAVDPVTGIDSFIANIGGDGINYQVNLTASSLGQLFVVDRKFPSDLYTIDKATGNATRIGSTGVFVNSIAMRPNPDIDDDGVLNVDDNCPFNANPLQEDFDGDGFGDVCDLCPTIFSYNNESAACIAVDPAIASCTVASIDLLSTALVFGDVSVEQTTTPSPVSFTKPDSTSTVDVIDTNLRITRNCCGGVFNQGSDLTSWAVGTCAAPTSVFYSSHSQMLQTHFRSGGGVSTNLPGSDTCLHNDTTGIDYDVHWTSWSAGGAGGFAYTRTQKPIQTPVVTAAYTGSTLPGEIDLSTLADGDYNLCVSATPVPPPSIDSIRFEILNTLCNRPGTYEFFLNGVSMGTTAADPTGGCRCATPLQTFAVTNPTLLANWNSTGTNTVGFTLNGNTLLSWVRAVAGFGTESATACIFDNLGTTFGSPAPGGGNCAVPNLCEAGYVDTAGAVSAETTDILGETEQDCTAFTKAGEDKIVINGVCDAIPPIVSSMPADPNPAAVDTAIVVSANVDDTTTGGSVIVAAEYSLDGGAWTPMSAFDAFDSPTEDVVASLGSFAEAGVHDVCFRGTDAAGNTSDGEACLFLAVYDPDDGFVTGGGWITSPAGACQFGTCTETTTGKANFGFVSRYKKGANTPTGETEFNFKAGGLNFHSGSYEWLVVANHRAQYKGTGTINGSGNFGFMLTAIDEKLTPSVDVDLFRIKIWNIDGGGGVVYDNQMGAGDSADPTTAIGGGSIVIH